MKRIQIICHCGQVFSSIRIFNEHRAMLNPLWPKSSPTDRHGVKEIIGGENNFDSTTRKEDDG